MKLKAGDQVLIDLESAETYCRTAISKCCGRAYDPDDLHRLLRCVAEGEWRVANQQTRVSTCPYCWRSMPRRRGEISLEVSSPFLVGGIESRYWATPRSWLRPPQEGPATAAAQEGGVRRCAAN